MSDNYIKLPELPEFHFTLDKVMRILNVFHITVGIYVLYLLLVSQFSQAFIITVLGIANYYYSTKDAKKQEWGSDV